MSRGKHSAAARLVGLTLSNGWKVTRYIARPAHATGGTFSHSYIAERGEKRDP